MTAIANITRRESEPKILESGHSSLGAADKLARAIGWFSIGLGLVQMVSPRTVTRHFGMTGSEGLMRVCGAREIGSGVLSLSIDKEAGLLARLVGDAMDAAMLVSAHHPFNPRQHAVSRGLLVVGGIALLDVIALQRVRARHARSGQPRDYRDRSGFPNGVQAARQIARGEAGRRTRFRQSNDATWAEGRVQA